MKTYFLGIFIFSIAFISCKQMDSTSGTLANDTAKMPIEDQYILHNQFAKNDSLYQQQRKAAEGGSYSNHERSEPGFAGMYRRKAEVFHKSRRNSSEK